MLTRNKLNSLISLVLVLTDKARIRAREKLTKMKKYKGLREDGKWDEYEAESDKEATPSKTGYLRVVNADGLEVTD